MEVNAAASRRESQQKRRKRRIERDWEQSGDTGEHWGLAGASGLFWFGDGISYRVAVHMQ